MVRDADDTERYVGQSGELAVRAGQWRRDPTMGGLTFEAVAYSEDLTVRLLWEQQLINLYGGPKGGHLLNKRNAIGKSNPLYELLPK